MTLHRKLNNIPQQVDRQQIAMTMEKLWNPLNGEQRQMLAERLDVLFCMRGERLFRAGEEPRFLYYLLEGHVSLSREGLGGRQQIVRMVGPGEIFGYQEAFSSEPMQSTAVAGNNLRVVVVPLDLVYHLIWENGGFAMLFIKELSGLLGISVRRTINLTQKHIRGRMAEALLALPSRYGYMDDGETINISLSREDLAQISNMTTSNAIRTLSTFAQEGLVALAGRKIRLLRIDELEHISRMG